MALELRRRAALVLAGGGALGAWQAGFLEALEAAGTAFDAALGFSAGALSAAAWALGRVGELVSLWSEVDRLRLLRLAPRLHPLSLFSGEPVWDVIRHENGRVRFGGSEDTARSELRCELIIMSLRVEDGETVYSRFSPGPGTAWEGPLDARLVASCSIPTVFPPVKLVEGGATRTYVDGGVVGREWMRLDCLRGCRDLLVLEMVRPDEVGVRRWLPWARYDQLARELCREQITRAVASAVSWPERPRVWRVHPSRALPFSMLSFCSSRCRPAVALGRADGEAFLADPGPCLVLAGGSQKV